MIRRYRGTSVSLVASARLDRMVLRTISWIALAVLLVGTSYADTPDTPADPRAQIASKIPGTRIEDLRPTPVAGIYELTRGTDIAYVTTDGKYAISGDLIDLPKNDNLTETRR